MLAEDFAPSNRLEVAKRQITCNLIAPGAVATEFISAIVMDPDWSMPRPLTADERKHMMEMFGVLDEICAEHGLQQVMHSHVQTVVETKDDIDMVLEGCDVGFCLDT